MTSAIRFSGTSIAAAPARETDTQHENATLMCRIKDKYFMA
jgi:hypothetical protein